MGYGDIYKRPGFNFSARGAVILNHGLAIGLSGTGFITAEPYIENETGDYYLAGGYGGLLIEPILFPKFPIHLALPVTGGFGGLQEGIDNDLNPNEIDLIPGETSLFMYVEPGLEMELNVTRFFRLAFGGYYRHTTAIDISNVPANVLNGFSGAVTLKSENFNKTLPLAKYLTQRKA
ncbi:MAG: hypothetical protein HC896_19155 [Bacteroidales bacterium]|nr:hypothetical protein [Bacteroidales bacterium]